MTDDEEVLVAHRELVDGKWHSVHRSKDGLIEFDTGPDDQRPDADGVRYFTPIWVSEVAHWMSDDAVWSYHKYCGSCRKHMGSLGEIKEHCPRCGAGIAHYVFDMGVERWKSTGFRDEMPDEWPDSAAAARP